MNGRDGRWSFGQRLKNDALYWFAACLVRIALQVPRAWLPALGAWLGALAHASMATQRRAAVDNLARVHPRWTRTHCRKQARRVFRALGQCLTDTLAMLDPREPPERTLAIDEAATASLDAALAQGRGVVFITCHLGPWERMAALLAARGYPISTVARESYDRRFHALVYDRLRDGRGVQPIYRGHPGAAYAIVRALRRGGVVGFLMDLPGRIPTIEVALLGCRARLPVGPLRIALRTGAPIVVGTPAPSSTSRLSVRIETLATADLTRGDEAKLADRIANALSERISALPTHWPWMHPTFAEMAPFSGEHPHGEPSAARVRT